MTTIPDTDGKTSAQAGPPPPFDPELLPVLDALMGGGRAEFTLAMIPAIRQAPSPFPVPTLEDLRRGGAFEVTSVQAPGPAGAPDISLLICRPAGVTAAVPALYHIHGGGMMHRRQPDRRAGDARPRAAAPDGRRVGGVPARAGDTRIPAPSKTATPGLAWTVAHAAELGIDPARVIVGGGSAGGGLSAAVALLARDRGGPALIGQLLMCPMLDDRNDTPSSWQMTGLGVWDHAANEVGWTALLGDARGGPDVSPYAAPARAADLSGLPPAFIDVGSAETFRDEDVAYATRIWQAGGAAELHVWPGGFHGFAVMAPDAALSRAAVAAQLSWLRRLLA